MLKRLLFCGNLDFLIRSSSRSPSRGEDSRGQGGIACRGGAGERNLLEFTFTRSWILPGNAGPRDASGTARDPELQEQLRLPTTVKKPQWPWRGGGWFDLYSSLQQRGGSVDSFPRKKGEEKKSQQKINCPETARNQHRRQHWGTTIIIAQRHTHSPIPELPLRSSLLTPLPRASDAPRAPSEVQFSDRGRAGERGSP